MGFRIDSHSYQRSSKSCTSMLGSLLATQTSISTTRDGAKLVNRDTIQVHISGVESCCVCVPSDDSGSASWSQAVAAIHCFVKARTWESFRSVDDTYLTSPGRCGVSGVLEKSVFLSGKPSLAGRELLSHVCKWFKQDLPVKIYS